LGYDPNMQILDIVLYGDEQRVRRLELEPGKLNIITGASKTGKSALSRIVEYCLGTDSFLVPSGIIANSVRWYGVRLQLATSQIFVARQAPAAGQKSTTNAYMVVGAELEIPASSDLHKNTTSGEVRDKLTRMIHVFPNVNIPEEDETRRPLEATISQALLLCFQRQGEVAAQDSLFHRQGEPFMAQTIKDTLPYFLGAVQEGLLAKTQELRRARRDLTRCEKRHQEAIRLVGEGMDKGLALLAEAEQAGLITVEEQPVDTVGLQQTLTRVLGWAPAELPAAPGDNLTRLSDERRELWNQHRRMKDRIKAATNCAEAQAKFHFEATEQQARLQSVSLFKPSANETAVCPICHSILETPPPAVSDLEAALDRISLQLINVEAESPRLREQIDRMEEELRDIEARLDANRRAATELALRRPDVAVTLQTNATLGKTVGRIEYYLQNIPGSEPASELDQAMARARERVQTLEQELEEANAEELLPSILNNVCKRIERHAAELDLENSQEPFRFDLPNLTIIADTENGPVPLNRMGSAANWLGYHLATHVALHEWFIQKGRPVPRFLFLDQPSQAYYPQDRDLEVLTEEDREGKLTFLGDEDRAAVSRVFKWLHDITANLNGDFQTIVTDHADIPSEWFKESIVQRWRDGTKLIPMDWLS
jgi:hypothetical protein